MIFPSLGFDAKKGNDDIGKKGVDMMNLMLGILSELANSRETAQKIFSEHCYSIFLPFTQ